MSFKDFIYWPNISQVLVVAPAAVMLTDEPTASLFNRIFALSLTRPAQTLIFFFSCRFWVGFTSGQMLILAWWFTFSWKIWTQLSRFINPITVPFVAKPAPSTIFPSKTVAKVIQFHGCFGDIVVWRRCTFLIGLKASGPFAPPRILIEYSHTNTRLIFICRFWHFLSVNDCKRNIVQIRWILGFPGWKAALARTVCVLEQIGATGRTGAEVNLCWNAGMQPSSEQTHLFCIQEKARERHLVWRWILLFHDFSFQGA